MKKIVILDGKTLGNVDYNLLEEFGEFSYYDITSPEEVKERIQNANIIITNKVVLNRENLTVAKELELICETATGYNNIDTIYAKENNIAVTNVAGYSTSAVAQHTFATLLYLYNKVAYYDNYIKSHEYSDSDSFTNSKVTFNEVEGKRWGIIGLGAIGRKVAKVADAFGAEVVYYSASGNNNNPNYKRVELEELLSSCDIISIHAALNENTTGLMNYENLNKMKKTAVLINMGRGPIVIEEDLARVIDEDGIEGAALDVFCNEPISRENPLLAVKNKGKLVLTPHVAWSSIESRNRLFNELLENIRSYYKGERRNRIE